MPEHSQAKDEKTERIINEIVPNSTMQLLVQQIKSGWPSERNSVYHELKPYYPYRDELSVSNGMLHNILIPPNLQALTLKTLHQSHQGMEKTKRLAWECIF